MSVYINPQGEYPRYRGDIMREYPDWQVGDDLPEGWFEVEEVAPPTPNEGERVVQEAPTLVDGQYKQSWLVRPFNETELSRMNARIEAKQKLIDAGLSEIEIEELLLEVGR